ncbi:MAG: multicopper oxidase domain-containing protein [Planctomycetota bacterium]
MKTFRVCQARLFALAVMPAMVLATAQRGAVAVGADVPLTEPTTVLSQNGKLDSPLTVVFGTVNVPSATNPRKINVRAYGLNPPDPQNPKKTEPLLPGPTFVFHPGDLLRLRLHNYMNRANNPRLNKFENNIPEGGPGKADDIEEHVPHEINIPNNADITNLHVHGLHVDPKQDNVTLLILPEDSDPSDLVPELQRFVPTINRWWTRPYQYKIPADHLPGTYWYHAHKHGATSTHVENGMAGTLVMLPNNDQDNIVPGLWNNDQTKTHDRVLVLQEIADFGVRQGLGGGKGKRLGAAAGQSTAPFTTINGQVRPTLQLPPGQLERWRFIIAGANHTVSSDIWVGKIVPNLPANLQTALTAITTAADAAAYTSNNPTKTFPAVATLACQAIPGAVKLVALDGITMWQSRNVTPATPAMGSAGNRLEMLIQPDTTAQGTGPYRVYQNYPLLLDDLAVAYPTLFGTTAGAAAGFRFAALSGGTIASGNAAFVVVDKLTNNPLPPNSFNTDSFALGSNYQGLTVTWAVVDPTGKPNGTPTAGMSIAPLISGTKNATTNGVDATIRAQDLTKNPVGWQPLPDANGAGGQTQGALMELDISGVAVGPQLPPDAQLNQTMSSLSPAGTGSRLMKVNQQGQLVPGIPAYVSPLPANVDGRQAVVFDRGQFTFNYVDKSTRKTLAFRQFWLNGRQFDVNDYQGNPDADSLIQQPIVNVVPQLGNYVPNDGSAPQGWTNQVNGKTFITNPGYYVPVTSSNGVYNFNYTQPGPLNNKAITGLDESTPPVSTTAEEWLLINNSDLFHPFHIHISPFFVTEIGQLNYDSTKPAGQQWAFKTMTLADKADPTKPFSWVLGNWWDVITLPPHGYVKMKTWINVPSQFPADKRSPDSDLVVKDNANVYGSWVLHCHILRHEDRGMMTLVNTVPKTVNIGGKWIDNAGTAHTIADVRGGLTITDAATYNGTFNQGIGNPLLSQPWLGSMSPTAGALSFCVTQDNQRMVLSTGQVWGRAAPAAITPATTLSLSGTWQDVDGNQATIVDTNGSLVFQPITPVWWAGGTGTWGPTTPPPVTYAGTQNVRNLGNQNQQLTFCVTADLKTIVFGNGIQWTRQ